MANYHLFCFKGGKIFRAEDIEAPDDAVALQEAFLLQGVGHAELWVDDRKVFTFEPPSSDEAKRAKVSLGTKVIRYDGLKWSSLR